jgi:hypothetical protein
VGDFGEVLNLTLSVDSTVTGPCAVSLSPTGAIAVPSAGATGTIGVTTAASCPWSSSSNEAWVTVTPVAGSGNGAVTYAVQANYGPTRQATLTVAGHPFTLTEDGISNGALAPAPALSTASLSFGSQTWARRAPRRV